ncbi:hypothetical protein OEZ86_011501 [Tetradesmus obliquus]|nr:hypothetical protein OEZ86_011486 [Tetradesmus obliquus]WIA28984.1 hypothetical protein OEZ86_011501 [Tetradesmus obliquus]
MAENLDPTPLLEDSSRDSSIKPTISECKLQEKCFLSEGAARGSTDSYKKVQRKLVIACILCFIFMTVEVIGGYIAKSVAIMSDAAHMLSDVSAFLVSIFATWAATQPSTWHYSFGYHRAEILGALISVLTIWAVTGALVFEAFQRTINPVRVDGKLMFIISIAGVVFNILIMLTLATRTRRHQMATSPAAMATATAMTAATLTQTATMRQHTTTATAMMSMSIGVAIAGGLIWLHQDDPRWYLADPICTFVFSIVVLLTTKSILRDIVHVLMERTPPNMDVPAVARVMLGMEGVWDIHDLHIWAISTSMKPVLTAHVHIGPDADANVVLQQLEAYVRGLGIDHSTIQICNIAAPPQLDQPAQQAEV